jgi:hypothetical protein
MFKRLMTLMVISNLIVPKSPAVNIVNDQQAIQNLLAQLASTHEGVYIETALHGFTKLAEGAQQLLTQSEQTSIGTKYLLEGVAQLTACALQGRNGNDGMANEQAVIQVEELVANFKANLIEILDRSKQSSKPGLGVVAIATAAGITADMPDNSQIGIAESKPAEKDTEIDSEKLLVEGLTQIFYNVFCMLISPNDIGVYLNNVFTGLLKVISAVLADGKVGREDLEILSAALSSIFNLRELQKQLVQKQSLALGHKTYHKTGDHKTSQRANFKNSLETQEMSLGLAKIMQSFMAMLANPKNVLSYLQELCQGLMHLFISIFADGKVDQHDLDNLIEVIKSNETKAMAILQAQDYRCAY